MNRIEPRRVLIAALGGQGGGVLSDWIAQAARLQGLIVQSTSTPGVSQRTGATTYYLELVATPSPGVAPPVLGLTAMPGRVDLLVCAEWLELARMLERGMCTPSRTTVIASTHRLYTTREKIDGGDGRFDSQRIAAAVQALSLRAVLFDMEALCAKHGAVISAVLFGALAGSGALGLRRSCCEQAIRATGVGLAQSLAAFDAAWQVAAAHGSADVRAPAQLPAQTVEPDPLPALLAARLNSLPEPVARLARLGTAQTCAYQDMSYGALYLDRVERIVGAAAAAAPEGTDHEAATEAARALALWMCYDDVIQVAARKAGRSRLLRIRAEVGAGPAEVVRVFDYFRPGALEIAAILPPALGQRLERWAQARGTSPNAGTSLRLHSSSLSGALLLRAIGALRPLRPRSLRFAREQQAIEDWLFLLTQALAAADHLAALELARLPRGLKGYGPTHAAGREAMRRAIENRRKAGPAVPREAADVSAVRSA